MICLIVALLGAIVNIVSAASSLPKISAVGSKFFTEDGNQFYIKGYLVQPLPPSSLERKLTMDHDSIAYQLVSTDPLLDESQCKLDASSMQKLGANTIRVYHVDPTGDHSGCMSAFASAGIYLFVDLDTFDTQINQVWTLKPSSNVATNADMSLGLTELEPDPTDRIPKGVGRIPAI